MTLGDLRNKKVASHNDDVFTVYDRVRQYIKDRRMLARFDEVMESVDMEEDADAFFEDVILDYMNERVAPKGYAFGVHAVSRDIGFWKFNPKTNDTDLTYVGMVDRRDDEFLPDEELDDVDPDEVDEEEEDEGPGILDAIAEGVSNFFGGQGGDQEEEPEDEPKPKCRKRRTPLAPGKQYRRTGRSASARRTAGGKTSGGRTAQADILDADGTVIGVTEYTDHSRGSDSEADDEA